MITRITKYVSALALVALLPLMWALPVHTATLVLAFVVWGGAVVVLVQAVTTRRYLWAAAFGLIALVFNPILPIVGAVPALLPRGPFVAVDLCCVGAFLSSVYFMKKTPRLSMASVTDTAPRSEAL